jgi:prolipoprotein diacylglyceryltransferase
VAARPGPDAETFHPTFLYESLWNLGFGCSWCGSIARASSAGAALLAVYVVGYLVARLWLETMRVDPATEVGGLRINIWMSIIGIAIAGGWLLVRDRRRSRG